MQGVVGAETRGSEMTRNSTEMLRLIGRTVVGVIDTNTNNWTDVDGFKLVFDDGSVLEISADTGQGFAYVIAEITAQKQKQASPDAPLAS